MRTRYYLFRLQVFRRVVADKVVTGPGVIVDTYGNVLNNSVADTVSNMSRFRGKPVTARPLTHGLLTMNGPVAATGDTVRKALSEETGLHPFGAQLLTRLMID